ncbi:MAG: hypothetical protein AUK03_13010 [Anaerolineae bacterium CG2_30_64_16]|nr:MAG: hypothetical protein AUK03_13010 [Anaerolineae bacterium CG2_30_64_16]
MTRRHLWVLLGYIGLSLLLTWPLAAHFASHVPGDGIDDPSLAWNLWWVKHALVDQPQNPFACDWQFWPVGINLAFYTLTVLNGMLSVPLQSVFGTIVAYNMVLLSSFVLSGYGAYLLCREVMGWVDEETGKQGKQGNKESGVRGQGSGVRNQGSGIRGEESGGRSQSHPVTLSPCHPVTRSPGHRVNATLAAFAGGALYAFASAKLFYAALGQGNIASSQWIPFAALYLLRAARPGGKLRDAALAALFLLLQAYAELTYATFLMIFAGLAFIWGIVLPSRDEGRKEKATADTTNARYPARHAFHSLLITHYSFLLTRFVFLALIFALGVSPFLANMLPDLRAEGDFFASGGGFADLFSADLAGYLAPTQLHPLLGGLVRGWSARVAAQGADAQFPVDKGQQVYLGYVALALAAVGVWRWRRRREVWFWLAAALIFFTLTLGPSLRLAGRDLGLSLPFALVAKLPFFEGNRYPSRYSVMLLLSLAPLVALGFQIFDFRFSISDFRFRSQFYVLRFPFYVLLLTLLLFEHLAVPLPLSDLRVPALYERVAAEPGDFALLELPLGWRNGARVAGKADILIMRQLWYQTYHGKRLLGGNTSRNPEFKFQYFSEDPTLARLIALTDAADLPQHTALRAALAADAITAADQARARDWAAALNIRYVMVHRDKLPPDTEAALQAVLPVTLVAEQGDLALYQVMGDQQPARDYQVGGDDGRLILAEGWSPSVLGPVGRDDAVVYAQRAGARLLLPLDAQTTQVRFYGRSLAPEQRLTLTVDGRTLATQTFSQETGWLTFDIPANPGRPLLSDVRLRFSSLVSVAEIGHGPWTVGSTGADSPVSLLVRSAGEETGDFAHIYVDGIDTSPNQRGYNLVALDPADGHPLAAGAFDTHADAGANVRLAEWVGALPAGTLVAGAARDEASWNLGQAAVDALHTLGVANDLRGAFRWGHAFVGAVGAPAHSAVEAMDGIRPAQVAVGLPVSAPQVAGALSSVVVGK